MPANDVISKTYEDIASGKLQLQICRHQPPNSGLTTVI